MKAGWLQKTIGEVCILRSGTTLPKELEKPSVEVPYLKVADMNLVENRNGITSSSRYVNKRDVNPSNLFPVGTTIFPKRGGAILTNKKRLTERVICADLNIMGVAPKPGMLSEFLFYYFINLDLSEICNGTSIPQINNYTIEPLSIPLPPLPEQHRIVGILDEAFDSIATAKANAEKNLLNARALFESHLHAVFAEAWQTGKIVALSDLATDITDGDHMPPPKAPTGVPFITIGNINKNTRTIDFTDTYMVPIEYFQGLKPYKKPRSGDVLYTVTGSFGIPVLISDNADFCFQRHIGLVRPKPIVNSVWLYYLLMSPQIFAQANEGATGTAQKTVSLKLLRGFQVPQIPLSQQLLSVTKLDALTEESQRLESIYQQKLIALDALKKSLLDQAFTGGL